MLQLRLGRGLDLDSVAASRGAAAAKVIQAAVRQHAAKGIVVLEEGGDGEGSGGQGLGRVRLSDPEGFLMSNDIISDVFAALDDGT